MALVNGSFEAGDTSGWGTPPTYNFVTATVVESHQAADGPFYAPVAGSKFALLPAAGGFGGGQATTVSQDFRAQAGDTISGWAFFDNGNTAEQDSYGRVAIKSGTDTVATLFSETAASVGDFGQTPWTFWTYTFAEAGDYRIEAGCWDASNQNPSYLGLDAVTFSGNRDPGQPQFLSLNANDTDEGLLVKLSGTFHDPTPGDSHTVVIDWGDGTQSAPLLTGPGVGPDTQFIYAEHVYQDQPASGLFYTIAATVVDGSGLSSTLTAPAMIHNASPVLTSIEGPYAAVSGETLHYAVAATDVPGDVMTPAWQVTDASGAVVATGSDWTFDFTPPAPGDYSVGINVSDEDFWEASYTIPLTVETHQVRPDPSNPTRTVLAVGGTKRDDTVKVRRAKAGAVEVIVNGDSLGVFSSASRIEVFGGAGDDRVIVQNHAAVPVTFFGGDGDDTLVSSNAHDVLVGGAGTNRRLGNSE